MEEHGICNMRFAADSVLKALHKDKMDQICKQYPKMLGKTFNQYKLKIIKEQKPIPLDYVMVLPSRITDKIKNQTRKKLSLSGNFSEALSMKNNEHKRATGQDMTEEEKRQFALKFIPDSEVTHRM